MEASRKVSGQRFSERTQISLTREEKARIDAAKAALGISMSEVVRRGVDMYLRSLRSDKPTTAAMLERTAGGWRRPVDGLEYQRQLRDEEERRLKGMGLA